MSLDSIGRPKAPLRAVLRTALGILLMSACVARGHEPKLPPFEQVEQVVLQHFAADADLQPGGIIAQSQVESLLPKLRHIGFEPADAREIVQRVPADGEFLVRELRTPAGREFMREIASLPNAYDRLDHLSRLPLGKQTVRDLIHKAGGSEMIQYMTASPGGIELGKMLSKAPNGSDFNRPTGRLYTVAMLLQRLKTSLAAAAKRS